MGGVSVSLGLLTHRLEWPTDRVRREAAFQLAALISAELPGATGALLTWIGERQLESQAALGVSIIHAFGLSGHIPAEDVKTAIRARSYLSDMLFHECYPDVGATSGDFAHASANALADSEHRGYFDRSLGEIVPLRFRSELRRLEAVSGLPFEERWFVEWSVLQESLDAPFSGRPEYIWGGAARENTASVQVRQTDVFTSAYLRTLSYAVAEWRMPARYAQRAALEALPFSRGLAAVRPIQRPNWSFGILRDRRNGTARKTAEKMWRSAKRSVGAGQVPLALRAVDHDESGLLRLTMRCFLCAQGDADQVPRDGWIRRIPWSQVQDPLGAMTGPLVLGDERGIPGLQPLTSSIQPDTYPRLQTEFFIDGVELAHPALFPGPVSVSASDEGFCLLTKGKPVSHWRHWYADWEPTHPRAIHGYAAHLTSVEKGLLTRFVRQSDLSVRTLCEAVYGSRDYRYEEIGAEREVFWL